MRYSLIIILSVLFITGCKKDKFTTSPQISFIDISPTIVDISPTSAVPVLTFHITDAEGDIGITAKDTAYIYMKNLLTNTFDSLRFPDLTAASKSNFKADVDVNISKVLKCKSQMGNPPPLHTDTLYFEIYVKDFAKNKSNVIKTDKPVYFTCF